MDEEQAPSSTKSIYKKIASGGNLVDKPLSQSDFDLTVLYIRKCFPKATKLQREIDQTLKRTFVLEDTEPKRKFLTKRKPEPVKTGSTRKTRLKKERPVPRVLNYENFLELNGLWNSYIADLFQDEERLEEIQQKLNRIDLHGALITVASGNCSNYVGLEGIVVKETKNIFIIVTPTGATKTVPKAENMFDISVKEPKGKLTICGNSFLTRPAERASKKMKSFMEFIGARAYKNKLRYTYPK